MLDINSSKKIELIIFLLKKKLNDKFFECSICYESVEKYYTICKSECMNYSYCKNCIEHIVNNRKRCPFTNIELEQKDICLDYRINKKIEENKKKQMEFDKIFNNKLIKNISIKIDT